MNQLKNPGNFILNFIRKFRRPFKTVYLSDTPDRLSKKTLYIIGEGKYKWYSVMLCPGGCSSVLYMNLMKDTNPNWQLTEHADGTVSLYPSIWRQKECRCHFWLRHGFVDWCEGGRCLRRKSFLMRMAGNIRRIFDHS